jgi:hypothetical protein
MTDEELIRLINRALDLFSAEQKLDGPAALARELDVDPATIWRWRRAEIGKGCKKLIPLVDHAARTVPPVENV